MIVHDATWPLHGNPFDRHHHHESPPNGSTTIVVPHNFYFAIFDRSYHVVGAYDSLHFSSFASSHKHDHRNPYLDSRDHHNYEVIVERLVVGYYSS
jgi:hypothetical protein